MAEFKAQFKDKKVQRLLKKINKNLDAIEDRKPEFIKAISPFVFKDIIDHFDKQEGFDGPWKKWSASYQKAISGNSPPRKPGRILLDNGSLRQRIKPTSVRKHKDGLLWFNNAKTKTGFPYAYAHDNDQDTRSTLPMRSFMWISRNALGKISKITIKNLVK